MNKSQDKLQPQFIEILTLITTAQNQVIATTNQELIKLYWSIGKYISDRLKTVEWGQKTIEQLAEFVQTQEPGIKGFEKRNLERMRQFYETYPKTETTSTADAIKLDPSSHHHVALQNRRRAPFSSKRESITWEVAIALLILSHRWVQTTRWRDNCT